MENNLTIFNNEAFGEIRTVMIDNEPWFVAKDVCDVFGETNRNRAMQQLDEEEKGGTQMRTPGGIQNITIINESGLYSLLFTMQPTKARGVSAEYIEQKHLKLKQFKKWVTSEVLPSIRKNGAYMTPNTLELAINNPDFMIGLLQNLKEEQNKSLMLEQRVAELEPKASYYDLVLQSTSLLTTTMIAKDYGMSAIELNKILEEHKIQFKQSGTWFIGYKYQDKGYTQSTTVEKNGRTYLNTKWTQKGRLFLYDFLKQLDILPMIEKEAMQNER